MQRSVSNLSVCSSNHTFSLLSVTGEGESLFKTKEQKDKLDKLLMACIMKKNFSVLDVYFS